MKPVGAMGEMLYVHVSGLKVFKAYFQYGKSSDIDTQHILQKKSHIGYNDLELRALEAI